MADTNNAPIQGGWKIKKLHNEPASKPIQKSAKYSGVSYGGNYRSYSLSYNGEKNLGEIGPIRNYVMDHDALRMRSWQAYIDSDVAQFVLNKFLTWMIGKGLKLQSEPQKKVLEMEKVTLDAKNFSDVAEAYFGLWAESKESTYSNLRNLNHLSGRAYLNSLIGGDVLIILRYKDDKITVDAKDGAHLKTPGTDSDYFKQATKSGNTIKNGIESTKTGEHVAYYISKYDPTKNMTSFEFERIPAKGKSSDLTTAYLVYGLEYRLDNNRGLPLLSAVMEKLKQLDRYQSATIGSAEERAKIAYTIEHTLGSTGENPLQLARILDADAPLDDVPSDDYGNSLADKVSASTNKQVFNLPVNSKMASLEAKNELYFKDFFTININLVCASVEIPPNVAMSLYDSNFSASRAAIKDWEHTLNVKRYNFSSQFYNPIYAFFLEVMILKNKINAPGYLQARLTGNTYIINAYRKARFVGANVPQIDPVKEVNAERLKLGPAGANMPLTTQEAATEAVNGGESDSNVDQFAEEMNRVKELGIVSDEPTADITKDPVPGDNAGKKPKVKKAKK